MLYITKEHVRINHEIKSPKIRVIDSDGTQLGILPIEEALKIAEQQDLDLVEVAPNAEPPVCRIIDFGKFKYEKERKEKEAIKKQSRIKIKEIKIRPTTEAHDFQFKVAHIRRFLENGDKAKVTITFRGREVVHSNLGKEMLEKIANELKDIGIVEQQPKLEGKNMIMVLTTIKK